MEFEFSPFNDYTTPPPSCSTAFGSAIGGYDRMMLETMICNGTDPQQILAYLDGLPSFPSMVV